MLKAILYYFVGFWVLILGGTLIVGMFTGDASVIKFLLAAGFILICYLIGKKVLGG